MTYIWEKSNNLSKRFRLPKMASWSVRMVLFGQEKPLKCSQLLAGSFQSSRQAIKLETPLPNFYLHFLPGFVLFLVYFFIKSFVSLSIFAYFLHHHCPWKIIKINLIATNFDIFFSKMYHYFHVCFPPFVDPWLITHSWTSDKQFQLLKKQFIQN